MVNYKASQSALVSFCLNLNSRPRSHTLSKTFDISQKKHTGKQVVIKRIKNTCMDNPAESQSYSVSIDVMLS